MLLDGQVSILGLTAAVDGLQVSFVLGAGSVFSGTSWHVDLAGLAISSDIAGLSLEGGLRKFEDPSGVQYVGMLLGKFGIYGTQRVSAATPSLGRHLPALVLRLSARSTGRSAVRPPSS